MALTVRVSIGAILLAAALAASGCSSGELVSSQSVEDKIARVALGQTTSSEVEATFGSPYLKEKRLWVYNFSDTESGFKTVDARIGASLIPPIPTTVSTNTRALITVRLSDAGIVKGLEVQRYFSSPYADDYWYLLKESSDKPLESVARMGESSGFKVVALDKAAGNFTLQEPTSKASMTVTLQNQMLHISSTNPYDRLSNEYRIFVKRETAFTEAIAQSEVVQ
ncbi:MAG TPA: hypothetical protein VLX11_00640 [Candidatus Acidoferrales bacterium]|nr:hypothetical protein [Candidatus Acidoferrales bacterium]